MIPEVILDLKAKNKKEAIEELAQLLFDNEKINDKCRHCLSIFIGCMQ